MWCELLFRQKLIFAFILGVIATRYPIAAVACTFLIPIIWWKASSKVPSFILLLSVFTIGFLYGDFRSPKKPIFPEWLTVATTPPKEIYRFKHFPFSVKNSIEQGNYRSFYDGVDISARIVNIVGATDNRLRLTLSDIRPTSFDAPFNDPIPGNLILTWKEPNLPTNYASPNKLLRPIVGQTLHARLKLRSITSLNNPGLWQTNEYWAAQYIWTKAWAKGNIQDLAITGKPSYWALWREALRFNIQENLPKDSSGVIYKSASIIPALIFGDKFLVDHTQTKLMANSTLAHSVALSGLHLGYIVGICSFLIFIVYCLIPRFSLYLPRSIACVIFALPPCIFYLWLGSFAPSLLRSALMLLAVSIALITKRSSKMLDGLFIALFAIILHNPMTIFDLSLQLSALSIASLCFSIPLSLYLYNKTKPFKVSVVSQYSTTLQFRPTMLLKKLIQILYASIASSLVISFFAQFALFPILANSFGEIGLSFYLNALWLPTLGLAVMPCIFLGSVFTFFGLNQLAKFFLELAAYPCEYLFKYLNLLSTNDLLPVFHAPRPDWLLSITFWFFLLFLAKTILLKRYSIRYFITLSSALTIMLFCLFNHKLPFKDEYVKLHLLDVGQGQSVLVEWTGGKRLLVDGGGNNSTSFDIGKEIAGASLAQNRFPSLNYMINSHADTDHSQGLIYIIKNYPVNYYADNGSLDSSKAGQNLHQALNESNLQHNTLHAGDLIKLDDDLVLEILFPFTSKGTVSDNLSQNDQSIVCRLVWKGRPLVIMFGDLEKRMQAKMLARYLAKDKMAKLQNKEIKEQCKRFQAEVLLLPHHGSANALLKEMIDAVDPIVALASCAYGNQWGFPSKTVRHELSLREIPLLDTGTKGQIIITWQKNSIEPVISYAADS